MTARPSKGVLAHLIEHHLPRTKALFNGEKTSAVYARSLVETHKDPEAYFGLVTGKELDALERIRLATQELTIAIEALDEPSLDRLKNATWRPESKFPVVLETHYQADLLRNGAKKLQEDRKQLPKASRSRNWISAAIAGRCREIWAAEEWESNPKKYGKLPIRNALREDYYTPENLERVQRYRLHIKDFAPTSDKLDAPGPFGRFLENILKGVFANPKNENGVSAQSALRSWNEARKQFSLDGH